MSPARIQRKRTRGWRMPECAIYVGRPTQLGNPFHSAPGLPRSLAFEAGVFRDWIFRELGVEPMMRPERRDFMRFLHHMTSACDLKHRAEYIKTALPMLRGRDLVCWCPLDQPCHADVLLELANTDKDR